jgi:hypothetical protein
MRENGLPPLSCGADSHQEDHLSNLASSHPSCHRRHQRPATALRTLCAAALVVSAASGCATGGAGSASAKRDPDAKEWIELFNGRNLDGWIAKIAKHEVGDNYANTFRVVDGTIQARYDGYGGNYNMQFGHLYYERPFS